MKKSLIIGASALALGSTNAPAIDGAESLSLSEKNRALVAEICKLPEVREHMVHPEDICEISTDGGKTWMLLVAGTLGLAGLGTREYMIRRRKKKVMADTGIIDLESGSYCRMEDVPLQDAGNPDQEPSETIPVVVVSDTIRNSIGVPGAESSHTPDFLSDLDTEVLDFDLSDPNPSREVIGTLELPVDVVPEAPEVSIDHTPGAIEWQEVTIIASPEPIGETPSLMTEEILRFVRMQKNRRGISEGSFTGEKFGSLTILQTRVLIKELQKAGLLGDKKNGYYPVL